MRYLFVFAVVFVVAEGASLQEQWQEFKVRTYSFVQIISFSMYAYIICCNLAEPWQDLQEPLGREEALHDFQRERPHY